MVAAMYDASLDAYLPHHWMQRFDVFRQDHSQPAPELRERGEVASTTSSGHWPVTTTRAST